MNDVTNYRSFFLELQERGERNMDKNNGGDRMVVALTIKEIRNVVLGPLDDWWAPLGIYS